MIPCKHYRKSKDKKYDFFCTHYNAPLCGNCSDCIYYEVKDENNMNNDLISRSALKERIQLAPNKNYETWDELYDSIIYEIDNAPTVETKTTYDVNRAYDRGYITAMNAYARPKGDLISRQDAIDALEEQLDYLQMLNKNENPTAEGKWYGVNWARNTIADLPYKQNERPKGEWRVRHDNHFRCTNCEQYSSFNFNYCPNCGADMKGGAE